MEGKNKLVIHYVSAYWSSLSYELQSFERDQCDFEDVSRGMPCFVQHLLRRYINYVMEYPYLPSIKQKMAWERKKLRNIQCNLILAWVQTTRGEQAEISGYKLHPSAFFVIGKFEIGIHRNSGSDKALPQMNVLHFSRKPWNGCNHLEQDSEDMPAGNIVSEVMAMKFDHLVSEIWIQRVPMIPWGIEMKICQILRTQGILRQVRILVFVSRKPDWFDMCTSYL